MSHLTIRRSNLALLAYLAVALVVFLVLVRPSLEGTTGLRVTADSDLYLSLVSAVVAYPGRLVSVGANYLGPFVILRLAKANHLNVALINCGLFLLSYRVLVRNFDLDRRKFVALLAINPILGISLLSINKEILAFASAAFMAAYLLSGRRWQLATALGLSILARWQMTLVLVALLVVRSRLNPFRRYRAVTLALMVGLVSVLYPPVLRVFLAPALESQFTASQLVSTAGLTGLFASVQDHYGYFLVVVPKLILSYFGNLLRIVDFIVRPDRIDYSDLYNNFVVLGHQLCMMLVFGLALRKGKLRLASDNIYFLAVYSIILGISVLISYRYFFPLYLLVCLELCRRPASAPPSVGGLPGAAEPVGELATDS